MNVITLYTKPGCHLCEAVEQVIAAARKTHSFQVIVRNILDDAADYERFQNDVPVVLLNGVELARHRLDATPLEIALQNSHK